MTLAPAAPIRVAVDARLRAYRRAGIAAHTTRLLAGLVTLALPETIVVLAHRRERYGPRWRRPWAAPTVAAGAAAGDFPTRYLWTPPHHRHEGWLLPVELRGLRPDLLHSPDVVLPRAWHGAGVATVHDVTFLRHPELLTPDSVRYYRGVHRSVQQADRVIAVSEHTRRELLTLTDVDPGKVVVVANAVDPRYAAAGDRVLDAAVADRHGLAGRYILFVSTIEPRKNVGTLLAAFRRLLDEGHDVSLALAGADGWHSQTVYERVTALGLTGRAHFLGYVPDDDLPALYRQAAVLAHPALDEGFGLTPLEAMAAGTPVVVADAGSLPEVVADAGLRVPATDVGAWAEALAAVLTRPERAARLAARGQARAAGFTSVCQAAATLAVYCAALAARGRPLTGAHQP